MSLAEGEVNEPRNSGYIAVSHGKDLRPQSMLSILKLFNNEAFSALMAAFDCRSPSKSARMVLATAPEQSDAGKPADLVSAKTASKPAGKKRKSTNAEWSMIKDLDLRLRAAPAPRQDRRPSSANAPYSLHLLGRVRVVSVVNDLCATSRRMAASQLTGLSCFLVIG